MASEVLSVKLRELDKSMDRLRDRLQGSDTADTEARCAEIHALRQECRTNDTALAQGLEQSKSPAVQCLAESYRLIEKTIRLTAQAVQSPPDRPDATAAAEEKIVFAEYSLDFAVQAANHALLCALEAIDAEKNLLNEERSSQ